MRKMILLLSLVILSFTTLMSQVGNAGSEVSRIPETGVLYEVTPEGDTLFYKNLPVLGGNTYRTDDSEYEYDTEGDTISLKGLETFRIETYQYAKGGDLFSKKAVPQDLEPNKGKLDALSLEIIQENKNKKDEKRNEDQNNE